MGQQNDRPSITPQHFPGVPRNAEEQLPPPQHASHPVASVEFEAVTADAPTRGSGSFGESLAASTAHRTVDTANMAAVARRMWVAEHVRWRGRL